MPSFHAAFSLGGMVGAGLGGLVAGALTPTQHLFGLTLIGLLVTALVGRSLLRQKPPAFPDDVPKDSPNDSPQGSPKHSPTDSLKGSSQREPESSPDRSPEDSPPPRRQAHRTKHRGTRPHRTPLPHPAASTPAPEALSSPSA